MACVRISALAVDLGPAPDPGGADPGPQISPLPPQAGGRSPGPPPRRALGRRVIGHVHLRAGGLRPEREAILLSHEYGHTFQSALLGPLYLLAVGLPSYIWANLPQMETKRSVRHIPYESRYPENWAEALGRRHFPKAMGKAADKEERV